MKPTYIFWGKIISGKKRGKTLGYPTANTNLHKNIPDGIYASLVCINGKNYVTATFIGAAETFGEKRKKAEMFLLDFHKNIYGKWITVYLYKRIRSNKKFSSERQLIQAMKQDVLATRKFFS